MSKRKPTPSKGKIVDYWVSYLNEFLPPTYSSLVSKEETEWQKIKKEYEPEHPPAKVHDEVFSASRAIFRQSKLNTDPFLAKMSGIDFGEPCCWSCGYYSDPDETDWNKAKYLEKCHIVPAMLGGASDASNLLLLCKDCHKESPDLKNPKYMKQWFVDRESFHNKGIKKLKTLDNEVLMFVFKNQEKFFKYMEENKGIHNSNREPITSSQLYAMIGFYEEYNLGGVMDSTG